MTNSEMYCEDYPCCGHTADDPCTAQWYDAPDAFDPSVNPHCFCDHSDGWCEVEVEDADDEDLSDADYAIVYSSDEWL
jgi:hypothetical protein